MKMRTFIFMTSGMLLGMLILLTLNIRSVFDKSFDQTFRVDSNAIRGIAVKHKEALYTLNFNQQNQLIALINRSTPHLPITNSENEIEKIVIYHFNEKPNWILKPLGTSEQRAVYSLDDGKSTQFWREFHPGQFQYLISRTYD